MLSFASVSKRVFFRNEFRLKIHFHENSISYGRFCTKAGFKTEAEGNSEMAHTCHVICMYGFEWHWKDSWPIEIVRLRQNLESCGIINFEFSKCGFLIVSQSVWKPLCTTLHSLFGTHLFVYLSLLLYGLTACFMSGQDDSNPALIDWLPEQARWSHLPLSGLSALSRKENITWKPYIYLACLVKMAWHWPRYVFASLFDSTPFRSFNTKKRKQQTNIWFDLIWFDLIDLIDLIWFIWFTVSPISRALVLG